MRQARETFGSDGGGGWIATSEGRGPGIPQGGGGAWAPGTAAADAGHGDPAEGRGTKELGVRKLGVWWMVVAVVVAGVGSWVSGVEGWGLGRGGRMGRILMRLGGQKEGQDIPPPQNAGGIPSAF